MNQNAFSLWSLWPDFGSFFGGSLRASGWLTTFFILVLIAVFLISLGYTLHKYFASISHIKFYRGLLGTITQDQLASRQRELTQDALADKREAFGKLWKEFDETLVYSPDGTQIFNTLDAGYFFNTATLSKGLTENRLLAAVPGFLTAIGVIGTFVGLTMGLATLKITQDAGVDVLRQGIGNMISGASVAFLTSVWGVFLSVSFNFLEKLLERHVRREISLLQNQIDFLYPRITPEQSLVKILDTSRLSTETLQGLAEKIGDRLQEVMVQSSNMIRTGLEDSLNKIMAPAIQSLVENAHQGSQQALESLLDRFLEGVGEAGNTQRQMMESASKDVQAAIEGLGSQMAGFATSMEAQTQNIQEESRSRQEIFARQLQERDEQQEEHQQQIEERFTGMINGLVGKLDEHHRQSEERDKNRSAVFERQLQEVINKSNQMVDAIGGQISGQIEKEKELHDQRYQALSKNVAVFKQSQVEMLERVESLISLQYDQSELISQGHTALLEKLRQVAEANTSAGKEMFETAKQLRDVTNQLGLMAGAIKQTTEKLASDIGKAAELTAFIAEENHAVSQDLRDSLAGYQQLTNDMNEVTVKLRGATESAERGFAIVHEHLDAFKKTMTNQVVELDEHIQKLLNNYADQVHVQTLERLKVWNTHTNEYISLMTGAVRAMNDVVDELESKTGGRV